MDLQRPRVGRRACQHGGRDNENKQPHRRLPGHPISVETSYMHPEFVDSRKLRADCGSPSHAAAPARATTGAGRRSISQTAIAATRQAAPAT